MNISRLPKDQIFDNISVATITIQVTRKQVLELFKDHPIEDQIRQATMPGMSLKMSLCKPLTDENVDIVLSNFEIGRAVCLMQKKYPTYFTEWMQNNTSDCHCQCLIHCLVELQS